MNKVQRYEWEDALIDAHVAGVITNGALLVALKLSKAINWNPKGHRPSGLYWANEEALRAVGAGRSTYFKHRGELFDGGFFIEQSGNLIPKVPESTLETNKSTVETLEGDTQSTLETPKSTVETGQSTVETPKSTGDNPYTVDTYTVDTYSDDATAGAVANEDESLLETKETDTHPSPQGLQGSSSPSTLSSPASERSEDAMKSGRQSTVETLDKAVERVPESTVETFGVGDFPDHFTKKMVQDTYDARNKGRLSWTDALAYVERQAAIWGTSATNLEEREV